jgi:hypothetical protein
MEQKNWSCEVETLGEAILKSFNWNGISFKAKQGGN